MKINIFIPLIFMFLSLHAFSEEGMDPISQKWTGSTILGVQYEKNVRKPSSSERWKIKRALKKAPESSSREMEGLFSPRTTTFSQVENLLTNISSSDYGKSGSFPGYTQIFISGIAFSVKGHVYFDGETGVITGLNEIEDPVLFPTNYGDISISGWSSFFEDGTLSFVCPTYSERDFTIGEITVPYTYSAGGYSAKIFFHSNGNIQDIHIAEDLEITAYGYKLKFMHQSGCGGDLMFYRDTSFRRGYLAEGAVIDGVYCPEGSFIEFWKNGKLRSLLSSEKPWAKPVIVENISIGVDGSGGIIFTENGEILSVLNFTNETTLYGKTFDAGQSMKGYESRDGLSVWAETLGPNDPFYIYDPVE